MTDKPPKDENPDAEAVFNRTLKNLLTTPHKPHDAGKKGREPKPAPKA
ncbi:MAG: hypothetical protein ACK4YQ_00365 [Phenylobacterium sp.]